MRREFVAKYQASKIEGFAVDAMETLVAYRWPGNVRQLANVVERACALGRGPKIELEDLTDEVAGRGEETRTPKGDLTKETFQEMKSRRVAAMESVYLEELLRKHRGNVTHSASAAGMTRSAFQKLMQRYGIKSSDFRGG